MEDRRVWSLSHSCQRGQRGASISSSRVTVLGIVKDGWLDIWMDGDRQGLSRYASKRNITCIDANQEPHQLNACPPPITCYFSNSFLPSFHFNFYVSLQTIYRCSTFIKNQRQHYNINKISTRYYLLINRKNLGKN